MASSLCPPRSLRPRARLETCLTPVQIRRRETPVTSTSFMEVDRLEKAHGHKSNMHVAGESDSSIVPQKQANKDSGSLSAESVEGRGLTKENIEQLRLGRTQCRVSRSRGLLGVREAALNKARLWSSSSKARAVCGSSARTDLCGGRAAMPVPTAIFIKMRPSASDPPTRERWREAWWVFRHEGAPQPGMARGSWRITPVVFRQLPGVATRILQSCAAAHRTCVRSQSARPELSCRRRHFTGFEMLVQLKNCPKTSS